MRILKFFRFLQSSLRLKFALTVSLILLLIFATASFILIRQSIDFQKSSLVARAATFTYLSTKPLGDSFNLYFESGYLKFREILIDNLDLNRDIVRIQFISVNGQILFDTTEISEPSIRNQDRKIKDKNLLEAVISASPTQIKNQNEDIKEIVVPYKNDLNSRPFSIRYFLSYREIDENLARISSTVLMLMILMSITTIGTMVFLVNRAILSPLGKIVHAAEEISRGDLKKTINISSKDELASLAGSLNIMMGKLKRDIEDLKQLDKMKDEFIFLASHNLRTPLTIIKGYTERLLESSLLGAEEKESLSKVSQSTKDLEATTESLLNLVALEKSNKTLIKKAVNLPDILRKAVNDLSETAAEKKINFILELPEENFPKIEADIQRLPQAFSGLVDNAIKFNKAGGKVTVRLGKKDNQALVSVSDTGIGIPEEEKDLIFKKFHRATDTLTYNYEGIGLGLYLTKLIIESHQGRIWFESKKGIGTTFYVEIPIKEEQKADLSDQH